MTLFGKVMYTGFWLAVVLLLLAAVLQAWGIAPLCDVFGYTGLSIMAVQMLAFMVWSVIKVWKE